MHATVPPTATLPYYSLVLHQSMDNQFIDWMLPDQVPYYSLGHFDAHHDFHWSTYSFSRLLLISRYYSYQWFSAFRSSWNNTFYSTVSLPYSLVGHFDALVQLVQTGVDGERLRLLLAELVERYRLLVLGIMSVADSIGEIKTVEDRLP